MPAHTTACEPVGIAEIAQRLGFPARTVNQWRFRRRLPAERWTVSGAPAWCWRCDIAPWAATRGYSVGCEVSPA